ncbi:MAG: hypothetical protein VYB34_12420 [Planctomycetota bacterium]|nr:hypothetical protein [Planctomycetota bacterium]
MKTLRLPLPAITAVACILCANALVACPYSIRDSAFIGRGSSVPFRLVFLSSSGTPGNDKLGEAVKAASAAWLRDSNVVARIVELDGPEKDEVPNEIQARYSDNSLLPTAILISPAGETLELGQLDISDKPLDAIMAVMEPVVESSLRRGLQEKLVRHWCVIVFVPGTDEKRNAAALTDIETAAKAIVGKKTELNKSITTAPHILVLDPAKPGEKIVLWSLGLTPAEGEKERPVRTLALAGRGETRGPTLEGENVNSEKMSELLEMLGRSCSCTTSPVWLIGKAIPLTWSDEIRSMATLQLGFDPLDPEVLRSIKGEKKKPRELGGFEEFELGYSEIAIEPIPVTEDAPAGEGSDGPEADAITAAGKTGEARPAGSTEGSPATVMLIALGTMLTVVLVTGFAILRRGRGS